MVGEVGVTLEYMATHKGTLNGETLATCTRQRDDHISAVYTKWAPRGNVTFPGHHIWVSSDVSRSSSAASPWRLTRTNTNEAHLARSQPSWDAALPSRVALLVGDLSGEEL